MNSFTRAHIIPALLTFSLLGPALLSAQTKVASPEEVSSGDIGKTQPGTTTIDSATNSYRITGGGADMWGTSDAFRFWWTKLTGDATITADVHFAPGTLVPLEKAVLIFRQSLDPGSQYADVALHADGHATLQYRATAGGITADTVSTEHHATRLRIERRGDQFTAYVQSADGKMVPMPPTTVAMSGDVYVGMGVCAHDANGTATVTFSNVTIDRHPNP